MSSIKGMKKTLPWLGAVAGLAFGASALVMVGRPHPVAKAKSADEQLKASIGGRPLLFELNRGQAGTEPGFIARGAGYGFFVSPTESTVSLARLGAAPTGGQSRIPAPAPASQLRMRLVGGNPAPKMVPDGKQLGRSNYFIGNDPKKWHADIPSYGAVRVKDVYKGVDLRYYGNQRQLEHDFIVKPGASPSAVRVAYTGARSLSVSPAGDLVFHTPVGDVTQAKPYAYQKVDGKRRQVPASYQLLAKNQIAFSVGAYDRKKALVIDPVLRYSTFIGGGSDDYCLNMTIDSRRQVYVVGYTGSFSQSAQNEKRTDGSTTTSSANVSAYPTQNPLHGDIWDVGSRSFNVNVPSGSPVNENPDTITTVQCSAYDGVITRLNPNGSGWTYSTYIGGTGDDFATAIAVDPANVDQPPMYVTGWTRATNIPLVAAIMGPQGGEDSFLYKLDPTQTGFGQIVYSTYLGGSGSDRATAIGLDGTGNVYLAGLTTSVNFPVFSTDGMPFQASNGGGTDTFVVSIDASGSAFNYSTYFGGSGEETGLPRDPVDGGDGVMSASDLTLAVTSSPWVPNRANRVNSNDCSPSSGPGADGKCAIAVDFQGYVYLTGGTSSTNLPTTPNAFQSGNSGTEDGFVTKFSPGGALVYCTYLGGGGNDAGRAIAVDTAGHAFVTGYTTSGATATALFPTVAPPAPPAGSVTAYQPSSAGGVDAFLTELDTDGTKLVYSTYFGGDGLDIGSGIAVSPGGQAYITGWSGSTSVTIPCLNWIRSTPAGGIDAFVTKFRPDGSALEYSTYLGGGNGDRGMGIVLDANAQAYVAGCTSSGGITPPFGSASPPTFPVTLGAAQQALNQTGDGLFGLYPIGDLFVSQLHAPPFAPSNLVSTAVAKTTIGLAWTDNSDNETGFDVERKLGTAGSANPFVVISKAPDGTPVVANQVTYTDGNLTPLVPTTTYTYRVRPWNQATINGVLTTFYGPYSNQLTVSTLPDLPTAPSNVQVTPIDKNRLQITWTDNSNNEGDPSNVGFRLERRQTSGTLTAWKEIKTFAAVTSPAVGSTVVYKDDDGGALLTPNTTYEYRVRSHNVAGDSAYAPANPNGSGQPGTTLPDVPTTKPVVTATAFSASQIDLTWVYAPTDAVGFKIYRANVIGGPYTLIATNIGLLSYSDKSLPSGTTYFYEVRAYNTSGDGPLSDPASAKTLQDPPADPSNLVAALTGPAKITLTWTDHSANEDGFKVLRSLDNFATAGTALTPSLAADTVTYDDTSLAANTIYYYEVVAFRSNGMGVNDSESAPTNVACALTLPANPTNPMALVPSAPARSNGLDLKWMDNNPVGTVSKFLVERSPAGANTWTTIAASFAGNPGAQVTYQDTSAAANTAYDYRVTAFNMAVAPCVGGGSSATLTGFTGTTLPATTGALTVSLIPPTTNLSLTWTDGSPTPTAYRIERSTTSASAGFSTLVASTNSTTVVDNSGPGGHLLGNQNYYYRVYAFNMSGDAPGFSAGTMLTLPDVPAALTASYPPGFATPPQKLGAHEIALAWTDTSAAPTAFDVQYQVAGSGNWVTASNSPTAVGATGLTVGGLQADTDYLFRVRGFNASGPGDWTTTGSATRTLKDRPTGAPVGLTATIVTANEIDLTWEYSGTVDGFRLERIVGSTFAGNMNPITSVIIPGAARSYQDTIGVLPNTTYTYRIFGFNNGGDSDASREAGGTTPVIAPPAPDTLDVVPEMDTSVTVKWTHPGPQPDTFKVERQTGLSAFVAIGTAPGSASMYHDTTTKGNLSYTYRVRATKTASDSVPSPAKTVLTYPATPANLVATVADPTHINLTWVDKNGAPSDYQIFRKGPGDLTFMPLTTVSAPIVTYTDGPLADGSTYTYEVRATNTTGQSDFAVSGSVSTPPSAPSKPVINSVSAVSSSSLLVQWTANGAPADGFKVLRAPSGAMMTYVQIGATAAGVTNFTDTNLTANTTYSYEIVAFNVGGSSPASDPVSGTTNPNPPAAPTQLSVSAATQTSLKLTWVDNSTNETGFVIERSDDDGATFGAIKTVGANGTNSATYTDDNDGNFLTSGKTYYYRVKAINAGGSSAYTNVASGRTLPPTPTPPNMVAAQVLSQNDVKLTWASTSGNEDGFEVFRSPSGDVGTFMKVGQTGKGVVTYTNTGLAPATNYYYVVDAFNNGGTSAVSSPPVLATTFPPAPAAPTNFKVTLTPPYAVHITWTAAAGVVTSYRLERRVGNGAFAVLNDNVSAGAVSADDSGLLGNTVYAYRLQARNSGGLSDYSNTDSKLTYPAVPQSLAATVVSKNEIDLSWNSGTGAPSAVRVERQGPGEAMFTTIATVAIGTTSFKDNTVLEDSTYTYQVRGINNAELNNALALSDPSNAVTKTTPPALPLQPVGLTLTVKGSTAISLDWMETTVGAVFNIERSAVDEAHYQVIEMAHTGTSFDDTGLTANTRYYYRIQAMNSAGVSPYSASVSAVTLAVPPTAPVIDTAVSLTATKVQLTWTQPGGGGGVASYSVKRTVGNMNTVVVASGLTGLTYTDNTANPDTTYFYVVTAVNTGGQVDSDSRPVHTKPLPPAKPVLHVSAPSVGVVELTWEEDTTGITGWEIQRRTDSSGYQTLTFSNPIAGNVTNAQDPTQVEPGRRYYYQIRALNDGGASPYSTEVSVTTLVPITLSNLTVNKATLKGGQSTTATVTLTAAAPAGGIVVTLAAGNSAIKVPASVTVATGQTTGTFTVKAKKVSANKKVNLTATYNSTNKTVSITVKP